MRIYLINLDRAPERLQYMQKAFDEAGLEFTRIPAVDGKQLSDQEISRVVSGESYLGWLTHGEVACFLSHRLCWEAIANGDDEYGAVFEDDALLGGCAKELLLDSAWIPRDADIVKIDTARSRIFVDKAGKTVGDRFSVRRLRSAHVAGGAYIISRNSARRFLARSQTFSEAVDDFLYSSQTIVLGGVRIYQLDPALSIQRFFIGGERANEFPTSIEGREGKTRKRLGIIERAKLVAFKESHTAFNKLLCLLGKRERIVVEFK